MSYTNAVAGKSAEVSIEPGWALPELSTRRPWFASDWAASPLLGSIRLAWLSCHCSTDREEAEVRSTQVQSSEVTCWSCWRRSFSSEEKTEPSTISSKVMCWSLTSMCCSIAGRNPARVTLTE